MENKITRKTSAEELARRNKITTPKTCETCLYMATHEKCNAGGGCLHTEADYYQYQTCGKLPDMRFANWVESDPLTQMRRLHEMQLSGARNILLGPGEAYLNTQETPKEVSKQMHYVAEECGYVCSLLKSNGTGKESLTVYKDFGPFVIEWENGTLMRILRGKSNNVFWEREDKLLGVAFDERENKK